LGRKNRRAVFTYFHLAQISLARPKNPYIFARQNFNLRGVAQFGSAFGSGPKGPQFKSGRPDFFQKTMGKKISRIQIAVIGGRAAKTSEKQKAEKIGKLIAGKGWQLVCGGLGGVMQAAAKGAASNDGIVIGVLTGKDKGEANEYVNIPFATGIGVARNSIIAHAADGAVVIGGRYGTLSEIAFFLQLGKPVVAYGTKWEIEGMLSAETPEEAIKLIDKEVCARKKG
jgi:uncharacterized protein (TIGR00725 family)